MEASPQQHLSKDEIQLKLAALQQQPQAEQKRPTIAPPPEGWQRYLQAAAVLAYYDPEDLKPVPPEPMTRDSEEFRKQCMNFVIGSSELVTDSREYERNEEQRVDYKVYMMLRDDVRKETLRKLFEEGKMQQTVKASSAPRFIPDVHLQIILTVCLVDRSVSTQSFDLDHLHALSRVLDWLPDVPQLHNLPSKKRVRQIIETEEILMPLRHLTGIYIDGRFQSLFGGRKAELSTLRQYVGVAPPQGLLEGIGRFFDNIRESLFSSSRKPLLIFGIGGIGKSTLLAQFILEHAEAHQQDRFPFVYLDFDKPQLNALEPETLLIEASRQIALQYQDTKLEEVFSGFYNRWSKASASWLEEGSSQTIVLRGLGSSRQKEEDRVNMEREFLEMADLLGKVEDRPFVMVLDTFEEIQYKGAEYVQQIYKFIVRLREIHPRFRFIAAGRAPVIELDIIRLELSNLDNEAAAGYLARIGITDPSDARRIVAQIGGNPLTLRLAADLVRQSNVKELKEVTVSDNRLTELYLQGALYRRILDHIHVPEVKKLAYPGMVLRRITADIILHVLAGPCGLTVSTPEEAQQLFQDLKREVSLVLPSETGVLRHRPDVRKAMLRLIEQSEQRDIVPAIHLAAAEYYEGKDSIEERAEAFYHRLSLDESPRVLDPRWVDGLQNYLLSSIDELPPRAQAYLLSRAGRESSDLSIWQHADMEDLNRNIARQATNLLNAGNAESALKVLEEGVYGKGSEVLTMLRVRALYQVKREDEATALAQQALESYYVDQYDPAVTHELQKFVQSAIPPPPPGQPIPKRGQSGGGATRKGGEDSAAFAV